MEYDSFLKNLKEKLAGVSGSSFSSFISESESAFSSLSTSLGGFDSVSAIWDDAIEESFSSVIPAIAASVEHCGQFASSVIVPAVALIDPLTSAIEKYMDLVDSYNDLEKEYNNISVGSEPVRSSFETDIAFSSAHSTWAYNKRKKADKQDEMRQKAIEINSSMDECYSLFNNINGILGATDSLVPPPLEIGGLTMVQPQEEDLGDGRKRIFTQWYGEDGTLVREDYTIVDKDGKTVEKGNILFHEKGKTKVYDATKNGMEYKNVVEEYDEDDKIVSRTTEEIINNGIKQKGLVEIYDGNETVISLDIDEVEYPDGTVQRKIHNDYLEDTQSIEEIEYPDGKKEKDVFEYTDDNKDKRRRCEEVEYPDGTKEKGVEEVYKTKESTGEEYLSSRLTDTLEKPGEEPVELVYEEYDETGKLIESSRKEPASPEPEPEFAEGEDDPDMIIEEVDLDAEEAKEHDQMLDTLNGMEDGTQMEAQGADGKKYTITREGETYRVMDEDNNVVEADGNAEECLSDLGLTSIDKDSVQPATPFNPEEEDFDDNSTKPAAVQPNPEEKDHNQVLNTLNDMEDGTQMEAQGTDGKKYTITREGQTYRVMDEDNNVIEADSNAEECLSDLGLTSIDKDSVQPATPFNPEEEDFADEIGVKPVEVKTTPMDEESEPKKATDSTSAAGIKAEMKAKREFDSITADLDSKADQLGAPYTEEGKKDAMLAYIDKEYGDKLPEGVTSEDLYESWQKGKGISVKTPTPKKITIAEESKISVTSEPKDSSAVSKLKSEIQTKEMATTMKTDLDKKAEELTGPYTEKGKEDAMISYIDKEYGDKLPAGTTSKDLYESWKDGKLGSTPEKTEQPTLTQGKTPVGVTSASQTTNEDLRERGIVSSTDSGAQSSADSLNNKSMKATLENMKDNSQIEATGKDGIKYTITRHGTSFEMVDENNVVVGADNNAQECISDFDLSSVGTNNSSQSKTPVPGTVESGTPKVTTQKPVPGTIESGTPKVTTQKPVPGTIENETPKVTTTSRPEPTPVKLTEAPQATPTPTPTAEKPAIEVKSEPTVVKQPEPVKASEAPKVDTKKQAEIAFQKEVDDRTKDLNAKYDQLSAPYTEEGKRDAMLEYIDTNYGDTGVSSEAIYNSWLKETGRESEQIPVKAPVQTTTGPTFSQAPVATQAPQVQQAPTVPSKSSLTPIPGTEHLTSFNGKLIRVQKYRAPDGREVELPIN